VTRYVVTRPLANSGLGSNLASIAGAIFVAERLGRELIVDWRGMTFLEDTSVNYFTRFLEPVEELDGVRIHYASQDPDDEVVEVASGAPSGFPDAPYLLLRKYHGLERVGCSDLEEQRRRLLAFYRRLRLLPPVAAKLEEFYETRLAGAPVTAINFATGNMTSPTGRFYHGRFDTNIFRNEERFLRRVQLAARLARGRLGGTSRIFFATDSEWMSKLLGRLPDSHTRRTVFPPREAGRMFSDYRSLGYSDVAASEDMFVDHFLLARCNGLIYNGTMFWNYGRVMTGDYGSNMWNIEKFFSGYWLETARRYARSK
jgi:hypothetical protein